MTHGEELMLLLELNGYDVEKYRLKKQLEFEKTGNLELYKQKKLSDLFISHYTFHDDENYLYRNPLTYRKDWNLEIQSLDEFHVKHPDIEKDMTLKEFIMDTKFNDIGKESILYDILDKWVEEYRDASVTEMANLRRMITLMPKKIKKQKKPSKILFLFSIIMALLIIFVYQSPASLQLAVFPFITPIIEGIVAQLYEVNWYSFLGVFTIFILILYAVTNSFFSRFIKDVRGEKNKNADRTFKKWEKDMEKKRIEQSGILEDYVEKAMQNHELTFLDINSLTGPRDLMQRLKDYVRSVEARYDNMTKNHRRFMRYMLLAYILGFLGFVAFFMIGYALSRGWM